MKNQKPKQDKSKELFAMLKELVTLITNAYVNDFFSSSLKNVCLFLSDVFVAAAQMEYFCTKDKKVASNIFELGFKKYKDKVGFVSQYLDFLIHLNGNYELKQNFVKMFFFLLEIFIIFFFRW